MIQPGIQLYDIAGEGKTLAEAMDNAAQDSSDTLKLAMEHEQIEVLSITSETLHVDGTFYYILKTLVKSSGERTD